MNHPLKNIDICLRENQLPVIKTDRLILREINESDVSPDYVNWLNDPEVNKYLEIRFQNHSLESVKEFCRLKLQNTSHSMHFGVYEKKPSLLIGTVTLPHINPHHLFSDISFVIGHPKARNKGYATEALSAVVHYIFKHTNIEKLYAGHYEGHEASHRILQKLGFVPEGCMRKKLLRYDGQRVDHIYVGLLKEDFMALCKLNK